MIIGDIIQSIKSLPFGSDKQVRIENLFHITFWKKMNTKTKLEVFQLLEDIISYAEGRNPSQIMPVLKQPQMASANVKDNKIKISIYHLEMGLDYLNNINAQLFCAIIHEHEHISQYLVSQGLINDVNTEGYHNNFKNIIPYSDEINGYTFYRFQAIEYYAHQISEDKTKKVFKRLLETFGEDSGYASWQTAIDMASPEKIVDYYNSYNNTEYTIQTMYEHVQQTITKRIGSIEEDKSNKQLI